MEAVASRLFCRKEPPGHLDRVQLSDPDRAYAFITSRDRRTYSSRTTQVPAGSRGGQTGSSHDSRRPR